MNTSKLMPLLLILGAGYLAYTYFNKPASSAGATQTPSYAEDAITTITTTTTEPPAAAPAVQAYTHAPSYNIVVEGSTFPEIPQPAVIEPEAFFEEPEPISQFPNDAKITSSPPPVLQVGDLTRTPLPAPTTPQEAEFFSVIDKIWAEAG